ncbi:hypothetical protein [Paraburkholderia sp. J94]|uniref:hypothetical protein n=1 Tax=Paraburkholderia sp. J94 TaxID=2805441 RepID=UPI002AB1E14B|nr:hypothetical protein [Paraburkholderia sp. J94]
MMLHLDVMPGDVRPVLLPGGFDACATGVLDYFCTAHRALNAYCTDHRTITASITFGRSKKKWAKRPSSHLARWSHLGRK